MGPARLGAGDGVGACNLCLVGDFETGTRDFFPDFEVRVRAVCCCIESLSLSLEGEDEDEDVTTFASLSEESAQLSERV